jgi:hypothetical protein
MPQQLTNFTATLQDWSNRQDWSTALVQSFISMCEQKLNAELRIDRMINFDEALIVNRCAPLPDDWLEMDLVRIQNGCVPDGFAPIRYLPRDDFFRLQDVPYSSAYVATANSTYGFYTIEGRQIYFGGPPDTVNGVTFKIAYYGEVPPLNDTTDSWVMTKYPTLYLHGSLMHADLHAVGEEDKAAQMKQLAEDEIQKLNANHQRARASGSRLARLRVRSFG